MTEDEGHLDNLAVGHSVVGAIMDAFSCRPLLHLGMGVVMMAGAFPVEAEVEGRGEVNLLSVHGHADTN